MKKIIFCDFDGVLCHDRYWRSLDPNAYEKVQELLFRDDKTIVSDWMRGKYTAEEVNRMVAENIGISFEKLWRLFVDDCKTMLVPKEMLMQLNALRGRHIVILMTGNMDSFSRFTCPALGIERYFDHISNSYNEGVHKTDNKGEIFLKYANKYETRIEYCMVFDDSQNVCNVFSALGGTARLVTKEKTLAHHLSKLQN